MVVGGAHYNFWEIWRGVRAKRGYCVIFLLAKFIFHPTPHPPDGYCTVPKVETGNHGSASVWISTSFPWDGKVRDPGNEVVWISDLNELIIRPSILMRFLLFYSHKPWNHEFNISRTQIFSGQIATSCSIVDKQRICSQRGSVTPSVTCARFRRSHTLMTA